MYQLFKNLLERGGSPVAPTPATSAVVADVADCRALPRPDPSGSGPDPTRGTPTTHAGGDGGGKALDEAGLFRRLFKAWRTIAELQDGLDLEHAEGRAAEHCVQLWLRRHPQDQPDPDKCPYCGERLGPDAVPIGRALVMHDGCWEGWYRQRLLTARMALQGLGLPGFRGDALSLSV